MKLLLVGFKLVSRPLNNVLKRIFLHRFMFMHRFISKCGQGAHRFEIYLNRRVVASETNKVDFYIKPLSDEAAFNKGVDYFVEVVFFYGVLISLAIWEILKAQEASDRLKKQLVDLGAKCTSNENKVKELETQIAIKKLEVERAHAEIDTLSKQIASIKESVMSNFTAT